MEGAPKTSTAACKGAIKDMLFIIYLFLFDKILSNTLYCTISFPIQKPEEVNTILAAKAAIFLLTELLIDVFVEIHFADSVRKQIAVIAPEMKRLPFMVKPFCKQELDVNTMEEETVGFAEDGVDFVVSLGGDGLLLHASTLFPRSVPPHICFNCGSMGFLTPFSCDRLTDVIRDIVLAPKPLNINLRMRLSARILHNGQLSCFFYALNEVAIQREGGAFMSNLKCFCDDKRFTTVQADGLVIATPTGSTAYSMSAGGSVAHPNLLGILFTPICPHSLSFRPIVFPETVSIRCDVPLDARGEAVVSFDGKTPRHLYKGDSLMVQVSFILLIVNTYSVYKKKITLLSLLSFHIDELISYANHMSGR